MYGTNFDNAAHFERSRNEDFKANNKENEYRHPENPKIEPKKYAIQRMEEGVELYERGKFVG